MNSETLANGTVYLTPKEVAKTFRVTPGAVTNWARKKMIESLQLPNGRYRIPQREVERIEREGLKDPVSVSYGDRIKQQKIKDQAALARLRSFSVRESKQKESTRSNEQKGEMK